jgi:hypothetical protein
MVALLVVKTAEPTDKTMVALSVGWMVEQSTDQMVQQ